MKYPYRKLIKTAIKINKQNVYVWASAVGGSGAVPPMNFHTWYSIDGGLIVLFSVFLAIFQTFFRCPPPTWDFSVDTRPVSKHA